jgi:dipeptidyl aminopeptidase/acylaminoacyl peptidase
MTYVRTGFPPTVIFHGLADMTIPPDSSMHLLQALRSAGGSLRAAQLCGRSA